MPAKGVNPLIVGAATPDLQRPILAYVLAQAAGRGLGTVGLGVYRHLAAHESEEMPKCSPERDI